MRRLGRVHVGIVGKDYVRNDGVYRVRLARLFNNGVDNKLYFHGHQLFQHCESIR